MNFGLKNFIMGFESSEDGVLRPCLGQLAMDIDRGKIIELFVSY
jgi:hypothetical protein